MQRPANGATTAPQSAAPGPEPALATIVEPYLLVLFSVPFFVDGDGRTWIDALWAKDLKEHTRYIEQLTLAACAVRAQPPAGSVAMDRDGDLRRVRCVFLPHSRSWSQAIVTLPRMLAVLWRELSATKIVHTAVVGWPISEAWLLVPLLCLRPRILYINVESAFWRVAPGATTGIRARLRSFVAEQLNRLCLRRADLTTFTHEGYRRSLLGRRAATGHVVEASWIDDATLIGEDELTAVVGRRCDAPQLHIVFAGRLTQEKGVLVLLDALQGVVRQGVDVALDIIGDGPLRDTCVAEVKRRALDSVVTFVGTLPYDEGFFRRLREYQLLVVPSLSDEQPRVVYDAYSQGLPVLASRTPGLAQCVRQGVTGELFETGDAKALQRHLATAASDRRRLQRMAFQCLQLARRSTHRQMHSARHALLVAAFPALGRVGARSPQA